MFAFEMNKVIYYVETIIYLICEMPKKQFERNTCKQLYRTFFQSDLTLSSPLRRLGSRSGLILRTPIDTDGAVNQIENDVSVFLIIYLSVRFGIDYVCKHLHGHHIRQYVPDSRTELCSPRSFPSMGRGKRQHTCPFFSGDVQSNLNRRQYFGAKRGLAPLIT